MRYTTSVGSQPLTGDYEGVPDFAATLFGGAEVVLFDLEYTAWPGSMERGWSEPWEHREVVQIASVVVAAPGFDVRSEFDALTRPVRNPRLSEYFTALTGIDDTKIGRNGIAFPEALAAWRAFVGDRPACSWGEDGPVLEENLVLHDMPDVHLPVFVNLRPIFSALGVENPDGIQSGSLANALGSDRTFDAHDALDDCRSVAEALRLLHRAVR